MFIRANCCHTFSNHSRCVRHCTNDLYIFSKLFCKPCKCLTWCNCNDNLFVCHNIFDISNYALIKLRFYRQNNCLCFLCNFFIVCCYIDSVFFLNSFSSRCKKICPDNFFCRNYIILDNSAHNC